jgi:hypothetical protein
LIAASLPKVVVGERLQRPLAAGGELQSPSEGGGEVAQAEIEGGRGIRDEFSHAIYTRQGAEKFRRSPRG